MNSVSVQRRARAKENLRRAILDAARELFATEDYRAVSMRRIAEKIEYSPTAIYLHFKDKEEILHALIADGFGMLNDYLSRIAVADPVERLRQGGHAYFEFAFAQPHYYRIMFQLEDKELMCHFMAQSQDHQAAMEMASASFDFIRRAVTEARAQGLFRTDHSIEAVSHAIWAGLHGAVSLTLSGHIDFKLPKEHHAEFYETVIENTLDGQKQTSSEVE